jgi:hypothetical protein
MIQITNQTIILLLIFVVIVLGIYLYNNRKESFQAQIPASVTLPTVVPSSVAIAPSNPVTSNKVVGATDQLKQAEQIYLDELAAPKVNYELNSTWKGTSSSEAYLDKYQLQAYDIPNNSIGAIDNMSKVQQKYLLESQHPFNFETKDNYKDYGNAGAVDDLVDVENLFEHRNPLYFAYA